MLKKSIIAVGALGLLAVVLFGADAMSYVSTTLGWVKQSVRDSVPVEMEIDRARGMCKDLVKDIRSNMVTIAKEEGEVERIEKEIARKESALAKERKALVKLRGDVDSGESYVVYSGRKFSRDDVQQDLLRRFERFKTGQATLDSLRQIHQARQRSVAAAREKLEEMMAAKRQLEVEVENLEARLKMVEVAETTSDMNIDDSRLGRVKELISDVQARLSVAEKLANAEEYFRDEIPVLEDEGEGTLAQFDEYFELERPEAQVAATAADQPQ